MSRRFAEIPRWSLVTAVGAALGPGAARVCDPDECAAWCESLGGVGQCVGAVCRCVIG